MVYGIWWIRRHFIGTVKIGIPIVTALNPSSAMGARIDISGLPWQ